MSARRSVASALALAALGVAVGVALWRARSAPVAPLEVEFAGCASVLAGPVCVPRPERTLALFVADAGATPPRVEGARAVAPAVDVQGGRRLRLALDPGATRVQVEAGGRRFRLALADETPPAWSADARALERDGRLDEAVALVSPRLDDGPADEQGQALGALARFELQRGNGARAMDLLRRAIQDHRLRGRTFDLVNDTTVVVYTLLFQERRFDQARALLGSLPAPSEVSAEGAYYADYYAGLLALTTGDLRSALRALGEAARRAERLGLERLRHSAEQVLAEPLQLLGRGDEAEALLGRLWRETPADLPDCERAQLANALGWNRLLAREGETQGAVPDPLPVLEQARVDLGGGCPHLPQEPLNVALNIALAHLQAGRPPAARAALAQAPAEGAAPLHLVLWRREIEARLDLEDGRPRQALARYEQLSRLAEATLAWGARWRAALGRARAWRALGRPDEALRAYAEAEQRLDDDTLQVPLQEGRESFLAGQERSTREHLELLLEQGRVEAAFSLARRARARILAKLQRADRLAGLSPDERRAWDAALSEYRARRDELDAASAEDWRLPQDRLRRLGQEREATRRRLDALLDGAFALLDRRRESDRPGATRGAREGELLLAFHPLTRGAVAFAADARGVVAERVDCLGGRDPAALGACLLEPFAERLRAARQVTLLPAGAFAALDLHALPFDGAPLLAGRDVTFGLDLGSPGAPAGSTGGVALLVGDPRGDLPAARRETALVEAALGAGPWRVERLEGEAAGHADVRRGLARADLFHFAGHGVFAGRGGWDSALPLAGSGALGVGDILALERAPRFVLLSGCDTARSAGAGAETLGLAQAFVSRGARAVVAAARPVDDAGAAALVERFYSEWAAGQPPASALRRAQLALRQADGHADWAAFRVLEP